MKEPSPIAVITGGSSGLGLAFARKLSKEHYLPVLIARNSKRLDQAVQSIREQGEPAESFSADVTRPQALQDISKQLQERFRKIDFLILNAGVVHTRLLTDYEEIEEMKEDIDIDLWGSILTARYLVPLLAPGSKVLIISSALGLLGLAGYSTYCAAKAGLINFAESLRRELLYKGISVYVACPADIDTPQFQNEIAQMPDWMKKERDARPRALSADVAAVKILKKCRGGRFLITINFEISLLLFLSRILPRRVRDLLLDRIFPRPL